MPPTENQNAPAPLPTEAKNNLSIPIAIVLAGVLIAGAIFMTEPMQAAPAEGANIPVRAAVGEDTSVAPVELLALRPDDHVLGNPDAEILLIEYSDTECPFCKRFHESMVRIMDTYGKTGEVAWVYRHFPLDSIHPKARKEAEALECAGELGGQAVFWQYLDEIFRITPANNLLDPAELPKIATALGIDTNAFNACLSSGKYADRVQKDFVSGVEVGVKGTPYTVVWNRTTGKQMLVNGAQPYESVKTMIGIVGAKPAPAVPEVSVESL